MAAALLRGRKPGILRGYFGPKAVKSAYFLTSERVFSPPLISRRSWGLVASARLWHPPLSDASVLPAFGQLPVQVILPHYRMCAPSPSGDWWRKRGVASKETGTNLPATSFSGNLDFCPEKSGRTNFCPEFFWRFHISNRRKTGRKNFASTFFAILNFRAKNFPAREISRPEKVRASGFHGLDSGERFTTGT